MKGLRLLLLVACLANSPVAPALAGPMEPNALPEPEKSPTLAATLTAVAPLALLGAGIGLLRPAPVPSLVCLVGSPLGFGAGHLYAGDYAKATVFAVGTPLAGLGAGYLSWWLTQPACDVACMPGPQGGGDDVLVAALAIVAVGAWASWDAYQTVIERYPPTPATLSPSK